MVLNETLAQSMKNLCILQPHAPKYAYTNVASG